MYEFLQSWYHVTSMGQESHVTRQKLLTYLVFQLVVATLSEYLRHIHLSLRQGTTCPMVQQLSKCLRFEAVWGY